MHAYLPRQVTFPEGSIIGLARSRVPVHVAFCSSRPLAFTVMVDLLDEAGLRYSIPVTATADNSLATAAAFWEVGGGLLQWWWLRGQQQHRGIGLHVHVDGLQVDPEPSPG